MQNKVVLITGASSGIGKALAEEFAKQGAKLSLAARNEEKLSEISEKLSKITETFFVKTDVTKESDCDNFVSKSLEKFGKIDILINNAGISMRAPFEELDLSVLKSLIDVNFWGMVYCTKFALPHIKKQKGTIVGISSIAGFRGLPYRTGYSSSKFAMNGFLESLRTELLQSGTNVLIAAPGFTASNIRKTALNAEGKTQDESPRNEQKMMSAEEVAQRIVKAIRKRKKFVVMTSQGKLTVFLNKWLSKKMDKIVLNHFLKEEKMQLK